MGNNNPTGKSLNETLTVEQKFAKAMLRLRVLRPFYSAIYEVMEKRQSDAVPTMGVTTNELLYNYQFVDSIPFEEFLFIDLHEVAHVALMHTARRENRDPQLWNVACDLYVNQLLAEEFGLKPGQEVNINDIAIKMPAHGLFCSSIDLDADYTENIYDELEKQAMKNGFMQSKMHSLSSSQGGGSSNTQNDGDGQGDGQGQQPQQGKNQSSGQGQQGQGQQQQNGSRSGSGYGYQFKYHGSKGDTGLGRYDQYRDFQTTLMPGESYDLIDNGDDSEAAKQKADKVISDAMVRVEMSSSDCGEGTGGLLAIVKKMRMSKVDWKKLLRKYLIAATSSDSSFSRPDKRMYYQKSIYPGQIQNEENSIKGVKVCIDTSGSISDEDIEYFCGQVYDLTKQFKIDAELIYWDAEVQSTGEFKGYKEFQRVNILGRGGTDPSVVFNYFDSKKCKVKPVVTLMFTDAYFSTEAITAKQRKKYKDTIWIMTRNHYDQFKPPFGRKAIARFN